MAHGEVHHVVVDLVGLVSLLVKTVREADLIDFVVRFLLVKCGFCLMSNTNCHFSFEKR